MALPRVPVPLAIEESHVPLLHALTMKSAVRLPPDMANLRELKNLKLMNNFLSGPFGPALGALTKLQYVDLSNNRLTGGIPGGLAGSEHCLTLPGFGPSAPVGEVGLERSGRGALPAFGPLLSDF